MKKKILTLEDLVKFCKAQKMYSFSSKENGEPLCVAIPAVFEKEENQSSTLLFADIKAFHTGRNENDSGVTIDAAKNSLSTFAYKPILAAFTTDKNGDEDFMSHEMDMDDDGNIIYIEKQVGCFTADAPWMETDSEDADKQWVFAKAAIPRDYTSAASIIERKGGTRVSVELIVNEFSYDEEEDLLRLEDIEVSGLTLLGIYEEGDDPETDYVREGMKGARLDIADFSTAKNRSFSYQELTDVIKETVMQTLNDIQNSKEGGHEMKFSEDKLNELLEKYAVKSEELTFDLEAIESDEALEEAFEAQFAENPSGDPEPEPAPEERKVEMSLKLGEKELSFAKSLTDEIYALTDLVNAEYAEDGTYYACDVYDGGTAKTRYVIMQDIWTGKAYKQSFTVKDGVYSLKNEREEVFAEWLTASEREQLDSIRSNYAVMSAELTTVKETVAKYEAEPDKMALLESDDYKQVVETQEFAELMKKESHFNLSIEDVKAKADEILLAAAKAGKVEFAKVEPKNEESVGSKPLIPFSSPKKRFIGLDLD